MLDRNTVLCGDCLEVMQDFPDNSVDAIVTDPPYGLSFMGKDWDHGIPGVPFWQEILRVAKPGAHMLAFGGTRTHHRLMVAIEDAGWEIRDCLMWLYGSGFPKSLDVSKAIDKIQPRVGQFESFAKHYAERRNAVGLTHKRICEIGGFYLDHNHGGASSNWEKGFNVPTIEQWKVLQPLLELSYEFFPLIERVETVREVVGTKRTGDPVAWYAQVDRGDGIVNITTPTTPEAQQWSGWGTALKPAWEPVVLARKPLEGTVAENVLKWGTGGINVDGGRIQSKEILTGGGWKLWSHYRDGTLDKATPVSNNTGARWPANLLLDEETAAMLDAQSGELVSGANPTHRGSAKFKSCYGEFIGQEECTAARGVDSGGASRFFYTAKADSSERNKHLTGTGQKCNDGRDTPIDNPYQRGETIRKNHHPTVKPVDLLQYLCRLITPPQGLILDPFAGSGSTGIAAHKEGFDYVLIEIDEEYARIARLRNAQKRIGEFAQ